MDRTCRWVKTNWTGGVVSPRGVSATCPSWNAVETAALFCSWVSGANGEWLTGTPWEQPRKEKHRSRQRNEVDTQEEAETREVLPGSLPLTPPVLSLSVPGSSFLS